MPSIGVAISLYLTRIIDSLQRLREFWEDEIQKAVAGAGVIAPTAGAAGAGAPPSAAERGAAFAAWMAACRLLEVEASELEVRTRVRLGHMPGTIMKSVEVEAAAFLSGLQERVRVPYGFGCILAAAPVSAASASQFTSMRPV